MSSLKPNSPLAKEIISIFLISLVVAIAYNHFSGRGIPLIRKEAERIQIADSLLFAQPARDRIDSTLLEQPDSSVTGNIKVIAPLHEKALREQKAQGGQPGESDKKYYSAVTLAQLRRLLEENRGILIDARNHEDYVEGHIGGARNVPALEIEKHFAELVAMPRDTVVLLYCNNAECHLAEMLSDFLRELEFKKIYIYEDGWDGWIGAGLPASKPAEAPR